MKYLFVCGGTGGHINPALALAQQLREDDPENQFLFIGTDREMEKKLIPQEGFELKTLKVTGLARGLKPKQIVKNVKAAALVCSAYQSAKKMIKAFNPDAVIGTGGYVCYPVLSAASALGIPTYVHESNAIPGLTTKLLAKKVRKIFVAFPNMSQQYGVPEKVCYVGTPIRGSFSALTKQEAKAALGVTDKPLVVSFWGSLGAEKMNEMTAKFIAANCMDGSFYHIHATGGGENGLKNMERLLELEGAEAEPPLTDLRSYIHNMPVVMKAADLVLCRSGASTLAELTGQGIPSILIPSPNVTNHHQEKNAAAVSDAGGAVMIAEQACSGELLYETVRGLLRNHDKLAAMSEGAASLGCPDACEKMLSVIREEITNR